MINTKFIMERDKEIKTNQAQISFFNESQSTNNTKSYYNTCNNGVGWS